MIEDEIQVTKEIKEIKDKNDNGNNNIINNKEDNKDNKDNDNKKNNENAIIEIKDINKNNKSQDLKNSENKDILANEENVNIPELKNINDNLKLILKKLTKNEHKEIINSINQYQKLLKNKKNKYYNK